MDKIPLLNHPFYQTMSLKIDFYLTQQLEFQHCKELCYDLVTQLYQNGQDISVLFNELELMQWFDHALWTRETTAFMPHTTDQNEHKLSLTRPAYPKPLVQCNMQTTHTTLLPNSHHLIQIVPNNDLDKQRARMLYKHLNQLGHQITVHKDA